ncbi:hypothetical protein GAO09_13690 [Rhizobiales bacterium RZME27]|jgi:hypothetical protein|uniref:Uncharacterized protein n=1 Tax=Endobacterium cereale TaxID=2663029 RepID=A0A6A8ACY3_9HYPH|nr:hypothetical protein [Endobacterium cereale]MEB2844496.1 hypothetical protein [Endobacterium cereale]MQY47086.1 hypothetical protein [Endobacterium cereale]
MPWSALAAGFGISLSCMTLAGPVHAEGIVVSGAFIVPFRDFDTDRDVVVRKPPPDYAGTCWRITYVRGSKVGIELVKGIFKPEWEDGKSFTRFTDETNMTSYGKFDYDLSKGEFSIFRVVKRCP